MPKALRLAPKLKLPGDDATLRRLIGWLRSGCWGGSRCTARPERRCYSRRWPGNDGPLPDFYLHLPSHRFFAAALHRCADHVRTRISYCLPQILDQAEVTALFTQTCARCGLDTPHDFNPHRIDSLLLRQKTAES